MDHNDWFNKQHHVEVVEWMIQFYLQYVLNAPVTVHAAFVLGLLVSCHLKHRTEPMKAAHHRSGNSFISSDLVFTKLQIL